MSFANFFLSSTQKPTQLTLYQNENFSHIPTSQNTQFTETKQQPEENKDDNIREKLIQKYRNQLNESRQNLRKIDDLKKIIKD